MIALQTELNGVRYVGHGLAQRDPGDENGRKWNCPVAVCLTLLISGCTDLSAVRDFAQTSSSITASEPVLLGWPHIYETARILAASSQLRARAPDLQLMLKEEAQAANADVPLAVQAGKALGLYMNVLAALADDKLPDVSDQASSISSSLNALGAVNSNDHDATAALLKLIGISLDAWRQVAISDLVRGANNDVQTIAIFLARTANAVQKADKFAMSVIDQYWEATGAALTDPGVRALLLRAERQDDESYARQIAQAQAAQAAFLQIAKAHAMLAQHAGSLSSDEVRNALSNDMPVLLDALRTFERN